MEMKRVAGSRRTIRYHLSHRPVERDKIQRMLEAVPSSGSPSTGGER